MTRTWYTVSYHGRVDLLRVTACGCVPPALVPDLHTPNFPARITLGFPYDAMGVGRGWKRWGCTQAARVDDAVWILELPSVAPVVHLRPPHAPTKLASRPLRLLHAPGCRPALLRHRAVIAPRPGPCRVCTGSQPPHPPSPCCFKAVNSLPHAPGWCARGGRAAPSRHRIIDLVRICPAALPWRTAVLPTDLLYLCTAPRGVAVGEGEPLGTLI